LHDWRWWASFVQQEKGKVKLPAILKDDPETIKKTYFRIAWGWNNERIASALNLTLQAVEDTRQVIAQKLHSVGRTLGPRKIETISLTSLLVGRESEETSAPAEPLAPEINLELRAEAISYFATLPPFDRSILRLSGEGRKAKEMAIVLGVPESQIYFKLAKIRKGMPEWFKTSKDRREKGRAGPSKSPKGDEE
jgi:DNA-directed RNA polymerase specialized sigma24 family protein